MITMNDVLNDTVKWSSIPPSANQSIQPQKYIHLSSIHPTSSIHLESIQQEYFWSQTALAHHCRCKLFLFQPTFLISADKITIHDSWFCNRDAGVWTDIAWKVFLLKIVPFKSARFMICDYSLFMYGQSLRRGLSAQMCCKQTKSNEFTANEYNT